MVRPLNHPCLLQLTNRRYPSSLIQTPKHDCQSQGSIRSSCYWCCNSPESCDSTQRLRIQKNETTLHDRDHQLEYIWFVHDITGRYEDRIYSLTLFLRKNCKVTKHQRVSKSHWVINASLCSSCNYTTLMFQILATTQNLSSEGLWTSKKEHKCTSPSSLKHPSIPSMLVGPLFRSSSRRLSKMTTQSRCTWRFHVNSSHNLCVASMSHSGESTSSIDFWTSPPTDTCPTKHVQQYTPEDEHGTWSWRFGRSCSFLNFKWVICRFHVNLPGCTWNLYEVICVQIMNSSTWKKSLNSERIFPADTHIYKVTSCLQLTCIICIYIYTNGLKLRMPILRPKFFLAQLECLQNAPVMKKVRMPITWAQNTVNMHESEKSVICVLFHLYLYLYTSNIYNVCIKGILT